MNDMDTIKESDALERLCPHTAQNCVGSRCMAWVPAHNQRALVVEVAWPEELAKPERPDPVQGETPAMFAAVFRSRAEETLKAMVGGKYADTGRTITAAAPLDFDLTKVRLTLEPEAAGTCSLIR